MSFAFYTFFVSGKRCLHAINMFSQILDAIMSTAAERLGVPSTKACIAYRTRLPSQGPNQRSFPIQGLMLDLVCLLHAFVSGKRCLHAINVFS
jgi:hypothetical protein